MSTDLNTLLSYNTIDLEFFEIRGSRSGVNNARTTGVVYVNGQYVPGKSDVTGSGTFASDDTVSGFSFGAPYGALTTSSLKVGDNLTADSTIFRIANIDSSTSFQLESASGLTGVYPIQFDMGQREYVVEPDTITNTSTGTASFTSGDKTVINTGPSWSGIIAPGDFIKHDGYQEYFRIAAVPSGTSLTLENSYSGDTTSGSYTAKKWVIGRTRIQYAKNDITYDDQAAKWKYGAIEADDLTTSTNFTPLVDGVTLKFSRALNTNDPDLMDVAVTENTIFARETKYETFQFALPVVPFPESSMKLWINSVEQTMYQDYVLSYSQNPLYVLPPPPNERFVANIMFLTELSNSPSTELTALGEFNITDSSGNSIGGIYPGSFSLTVDGTTQVPYRDYVLEGNSGTINIIDSTVNEEIVKYVGSDYSDYIDYGFKVYLNGIEQKISFPAEIDDDILFQVAIGRLKPRDKDHPGPGEIYQINYMVESNPVSDELIVGTDGGTVIATSSYPIKQDSILLIKNDTILTEDEDYFVSYLTGRISLIDTLTSQDNFSISYTPLSKQVNNLFYTDNAWYCTVNDSRLTIVDADNYRFSLINLSLDAGEIQINRIYNETRDGDYDLTNIQTEGPTLLLEKNATNTSIGLKSTDVVLIDYTFESESTEYYPVVVNNLNITEGVKTVYIEGSDLTSFIDASSILTLARPDSAVQYYHTILSSSYDNYGTRINIETPIFEDIINPKMFIGDSAPTYLSVPLTAGPIISGSTNISFFGDNIQNIFRSKTILDVSNDLYQVASASYDSDTTTTTVNLRSGILYDRTDSTDLSSLKYSDNPYYLEGDTEIYASETIATLSDQPGFIMNYNSDQIIEITTTESDLTVDGTSFSYNTYPTLSDLSGAMTVIPSLAVTTYIPAWQSSKIELVTELSVFRDSSTVLNVSNALRYKSIDATAFVDTTDYSISNRGTVILDNPLVRGDKYNLDYMGLEFLGNKQVSYTAGYFDSLPAKSEVKASFQFVNLDQFYIQVLDQRDFFSSVTIPRMREEAIQLSGSVGQGGEVIGDEGNDNASGGITGDEYARQDMEIECRVFQNIYDFFSNRLEAYGDEMEASVGLKLFNNDGIFTQQEQDAANKTVSRIFPDVDNTNFEPMEVNPLTGYFFDNGAKFVNGSTTVTSTGNTLWTLQLNNSGYIGSADSTKRYQINSITNNAELELTTSYGENSSNVNDGERYTAVNTDYPVYDDDGFVGARIIGTRASNFGLINGDTFEIFLDGTDLTHKKTYTFLDTFFPVANLNGPLVAGLLSTINGLSCTYESVLDPTTTYGYRSTLVFRTDSTVNYMKLGDTTTTTKLGFVRDDTVYGNYDRLNYSSSAISLNLVPPEAILDSSEAHAIGEELGYQSSLIALGSPDKLNRISPAGLIFASEIYNSASSQVDLIYQEIPKIEEQITATGLIIAEEDIPSADTSTAHLNATLMLADTSAALIDATGIITDWQGKGTDWEWVSDFTQHSVFIRGKDSTNVGVPVSSGPGITNIDGQQSFILQAPAGYDRRILNNTIFSVTYYPAIVDATSNIPFDGTWTGWGIYGYSNNNEITFTLDQPNMIFLNNVSMAGTNQRYITDSTALNILWDVGPSTTTVTFPYATYATVSSMKIALNTISGLSATGPAIHDASICKAFLILPPQSITPDATVYPGLRDATVAYQTISDMMLADRTNFASDRSNFLVNRIDYLTNTRNTQIKNAIKNEQLLLDNGEPSDLYNWANNRFNRRQGCYAKLKQIEQQIASNESALQINKSFF